MDSDQRLYPYTDADMKSIASTYRAQTADHLAAFQAFDPQLDATFLNDWKLAIEAAYDIPTDETIMDIMQSRTAHVNSSHAACMDAMRDLRYYASKAFAKTSSERALLNFNGLNKARHSISRTVVYMLAEHRAATELAAPLQAKGMLPAQIDALETTAQALLLAETDHEYHKHQRLMLTRKRVELGNHLWSFCQQVNQASKAVFASDETLLGMFELKR